MALKPALSKNGTDTTLPCIYNDSTCEELLCVFYSIPPVPDASSNVLCNGFNMASQCDAFGWHRLDGSSIATCIEAPCNEDHEVILNGTNGSPNVLVNGFPAAVGGQEMFCHKVVECIATQFIYKTITVGGAPNVLVTT